MLIAWVLRVDHHGRVAEHGFRTRCSNSQRTAAIGQRVTDVPEETILFFRQHFQVRHGRVEFRVPVNETLAAVDEAFVVETYKALGYSFRQTLVHRESFACPVTGAAEAAHLLCNRAARIGFPFPDLFQELFATQIVARDIITFQLPFNHDLRGDAGVIGARLPQRIRSAHAVVSCECIHQRLVEAMAHVQRAGDVGWWQQNAEGFILGSVIACCEVTAIFPGLVPAAFDFGGFKGFGKRHGIQFKRD